MNPRTSLAVAMGLLLFASASFAQLTGLEGDVKGVDGKLVPNAAVRIARLDAKRTYPAKADKKGHYFYNGLPAGLYSITVQIDAQDAGGVSGVLTRPGAPLVVDIFLADKPEQQAQRTRQQVRQVGAEWAYVKPLVVQGTSATASAPAQEADLCREVGCSPEALDDYLAEYFVEHDIHAVMDGKGRAAERTLSVVREHDGVRWDGFTSKPEGVEPLHFQVRLFSPNDRADNEWPEKLRRRGLRVM